MWDRTCFPSRRRCVFDIMSLYNHFRRDEQPFVDRVFEWIGQVRDRYQTRVTDFLDPRQVFITRSLVGRETDVHVGFEGGYEEAERVRAVICPEFIQPELQDFQLSLLQISAISAFDRLEHRDFLGAILSLGLKRDKFGDLIMMDERQCQLVVAAETAEYVRVHLNRVGRSPVHVEGIDLQQIRPPQQKLEKTVITVSSPRLDAVLSDVYHLSRAKVLTPIRNGRVKVNWKVTDQPDTPLQQGDVVSFKGYGRFRITGWQGQTKKGRLILEIGKYM